MVHALPSQVPPPPISTQSPKSKSAPTPTESEIMTSWKQTSEPIALKPTLNNTASPGSTASPESVKPTRVLPLKLMEKPESPDVPPDIELMSIPSRSIWKPQTSKGLFITTSKEFDVTLLKLKPTGSHEVPSPSQTPQASNSAEPPQTPAQSSTLPSQSQSPSGMPSPSQTPHSSSTEEPPQTPAQSITYSQLPSSVFASAL